MVLASRDTGSKPRALSIGLSLCLLAVAGRATAQHSCSPGNTGQLCAACKPGWSRIDGPDGALTQGDCERCPDPTNCLGGEPSACAVGSEGQLCAVCSVGWSRIDGLAPDEPCKECGVGNWLALFVGTVGVFVLAPAAVFLASALDGRARGISQSWSLANSRDCQKSTTRRAARSTWAVLSVCVLTTTS